MTDQLPIVKGTLDTLVLRALAWNEMHSFEIMSWLEEQSGGSLDIDDHALYQALCRMEERGLISAVWGATPNNRRARYYSVSESGRAHLRAETKKWVRYADIVTGILTKPIRSR